MVRHHLTQGFKELIMWGVAAYVLAGATLLAGKGLLWVIHLIL